MIIEVGIKELKADLSRYLQAAQDGHEVLIKDGNRAIARLVPPETDFLEIAPATTPLHELAKLDGTRPAGITPEEIDEALRWTRRDSIDREDKGE